MRKIVVLAGLLFGGVILAGTPAQAAVGCACVKLGAAPVCVATIAECVQKRGGLCLAICQVEPAKKLVRHKAKKTG